MKIAILGAGGVRTPLIVQSMLKRQDRLGLDELVLMDIDPERLEIIGALTAPLEQSGAARFRIQHTTDPLPALDGADYVITTFRVGGIESRIIDERVPLSHGVLGQETTGPGGFAMGMRSIPVLLGYLDQMREYCPDAWLINFANPAGMMAESAIRAGGWQRTVGICDTPSLIQRVGAAAISILTNTRIAVREVYLEYFGLNHLGWARAVRYRDQDYLPQLIEMLRTMKGIHGFPFDPELISALGMIPNEYLYYYYYAAQSVTNLLRVEETRGEQIAAFNQKLFTDLRRLKEAGREAEMPDRLFSYLDQRSAAYMSAETGQSHTHNSLDSRLQEAFGGEGYAGVALNLIEALSGGAPDHGTHMVLNVPNQGVITGMDAQAVVEIPALVLRDQIQPLAVGEVPVHCLGLMQRVKAYERLTIEAATEGSYAKALLALTIHPLVSDWVRARLILDGYRQQHGDVFPPLS